MTDLLNPYYKYAEVLKTDKDDDPAGQTTWLCYIYPKETYEIYQAEVGAEVPDVKNPLAIDVFSALDEVTVLSRAKERYPALLIAFTEGEVESLPL